MQAKQIHTDIERSRLTAREIVAQHEKTKPLESKVVDASAKVDLLQVEIAFNEAVTNTLEEAQNISQRVESGRTALSNGDITAAIETVEEMLDASGSNRFANTNLMSILIEDINGLQQEIVDVLVVRWNDQVVIDRQKGDLQIKSIDGKLALKRTTVQN